MDAFPSMTRAVVAFVAVAYLFSAAFALLRLSGDHVALGVAMMFVPALSAWIVGAATGERLNIDWSRLPLRYLPIALLLIPVLMHAAMLPVTVIEEGRLPWQDWLTRGPDGLYHSPADRGWGTLTAAGLGVRVALNAVFGVVVVSLLALFEEIGWRGWLLPRLALLMGARYAIVAVAAIWGVWHVPFGLAGGDGSPLFSHAAAAFGWAFGVFVFGLIIGWLWMRTESIWIAAISHGALNNWGQYAFKYMRDFTTANEGQVLLAGITAVLVVAIGLLTFAMPRPLRRD